LQAKNEEHLESNPMARSSEAAAAAARGDSSSSKDKDLSSSGGHHNSHSPRGRKSLTTSHGGGGGTSGEGVELVVTLNPMNAAAMSLGSSIGGGASVALPDFAS